MLSNLDREFRFAKTDGIKGDGQRAVPDQFERVVGGSTLVMFNGQHVGAAALY